MALFDTIRAGSSGATDFEVQRSLRFNGADGAFLERTPSSSSNKRTMTFSFWFKRAVNDNFTTVFRSFGNASNRHGIDFVSGGQLRLWGNYNGSVAMTVQPTQVFRDFTAWYHFVLALDTTQGTASNRVKMYINGDQITDFETASYPSQNFDFGFNDSNAETQIGTDGGTSCNFYLAEFHEIDGLQLTPSSFAETDTLTGQWNPIDTSSLTFGTNGFRLNFSDNSGTTATTLGKDSSGNGNNFTPNNFSVSAGSGNDSVTDTPTNNWCTLNPLAMIHTGNVTPSNGNLDASFGTVSGGGGIASNFVVRSGKWYWETKVTAASSSALHIGVLDENLAPFAGSPFYDPGVTAESYSYQINGTKYNNNTNTSYGDSYTTDDIIGVKLDLDNGTIEFLKNNSSQGTAFTGLTGGFTPAYGDGSTAGTHSIAVNFGQQGFTYTIPTGYKALSSQNLPEPTVSQGNEYFDVLLWSGTNLATTRDITGLEFSPDWVWIKARNKHIYGGGLEYHHLVWDTVRGAGSNSSSGAGKDLVIDINTTRGEGSQVNVFSGFYGHVSSFNSDGFTVQKKSGEPPLYTDTSGANYVGWCWDAGSSTVTNTDGSVSAQVRANPSAGFSIITWTGTGSNLTIGHGLGVKPTAHITVARTGSSVGCDWFVYFSVLGATTNLRWNRSSTAGTTGQSDLYNDTEPTSSVITIGDSSCINVSGGTYVTYAFTDIEGYSKFGKYTGNGNSDGPFVFTGFRPAFLMIKTREQAGDWITIDSTRDVDNPNQHRLDANLSDAESSGDVYHDFLANGFKLRTSSASRNPSGQEMVYFAFAENPFKFARAR